MNICLLHILFRPKAKVNRLTIKHLCFFAAFLSLILSEAKGLSTPSSKKDNLTNDANANTKELAMSSEELSKTFDSVEKEESIFDNIESVLDNPFINNSLRTGTALINQSIENLMDAIFYQLLDQKWVLVKNEGVAVNLSTNRKVYSSEQGTYVVVDKVTIGPEYTRLLGEFEGIPINLNTGAGSEFYEIYPRSDIRRLIENDEDDLATWSFKNWGGLLSILTYALPPSFNPNELYDPGRLISVPFKLPLSRDSFETMPYSSVRSYAVRGGVNIPFTLDAKISGKLKEQIAQVAGSATALPYSVFVDGEHRINVMRKSVDVAWVGVSRKGSFGHGLFGVIGKTLYAFSELSDSLPFEGLPVPFFPLDIDITSAINRSYSLLFAFDFSKGGSVEVAYKEAVRGNFGPAHLAAKNQESGVTYFFTKNANGSYKRSRNALELGIFLNADQRTSRKSNETIESLTKTYYTLNSSETTEFKTWDILVGTTSLRAAIDLLLHVTPKDENSFLLRKMPNPITFKIRAEQRDTFTSGIEILKYKKLFENLSGFDLAPLGKFAKTNPEAAEISLANKMISHPSKRQINFTPPPQLLGNFKANFLAMASTSQLKKIIENAETSFFNHYREALGVAPLVESNFSGNHPSHLNRSSNLAKKPSLTSHSSAENFFTRTFNLAASPLRAINIPLIMDTRENELLYRTHLLSNIDLGESPQKIRDQFNDFFQTDWPIELLGAFSKSMGAESGYIKLDLTARPAIGVEPGQAANFGLLSKLNYEKGIPPIDWLDYKDATLNQNTFNPRSILSAPRSKNITRISLSKRETEMKKGPIPYWVKIYIEDGRVEESVKIYLKIENSGKLDLGRLVLGEKVTTTNYLVDSEGSYVEVNLEEFEVFNSFFSRQAVDFGMRLRLSVAISESETSWSTLRSIEFDP